MRDCEALRRLECNEAEKAELMMFLTPKLCNKKLLTDDSPTATRITVTVTFRFQRLSFRRRSHFCAAIAFLDLFFRRLQANYESRKSVWLHAEKIGNKLEILCARREKKCLQPFTASETMGKLSLCHYYALQELQPRGVSVSEVLIVI